MFLSPRKQTLHHYNTDMHLPTDCQDIIGECFNLLNSWFHAPTPHTPTPHPHTHTHTGRDKEMAVFLEELMHVSEHTPRDPGVIVLTGGGGMGKTKILRAMKAKAAIMGFRY